MEKGEGDVNPGYKPWELSRCWAGMTGFVLWFIFLCVGVDYSRLLHFRYAEIPAMMLMFFVPAAAADLWVRYQVGGWLVQLRDRAWLSIRRFIRPR